jgi:hypothetical protein
MTDSKPPEGSAEAPAPGSAATSPEEPEALRDSKDEDALAALVRRSLAGPAPSTGKDLDLLRGVQKRIRQRSKGKFFSDGWSTSESRLSYAIVALAMLTVVGVAYFALAWITVR